VAQKPEIYSIEQLEKHYGIDRKALNDRCLKGKLRAFKAGRSWYVLGPLPHIEHLYDDVGTYKGAQAMRGVPKRAYRERKQAEVEVPKPDMWEMHGYPQEIKVEPARDEHATLELIRANVLSMVGRLDTLIAQNGRLLHSIETQNDALLIAIDRLRQAWEQEG